MILEKDVRKRAARPLFKPRAQKVFVVVRPVRMAARLELQPGTEIAFGDIRRFQLQSLYQRRRIGAKGDDWTNYMLDAWDGKLVSGKFADGKFTAKRKRNGQKPAKQKRNGQKPANGEPRVRGDDNLRVVTVKDGNTNVHTVSVLGETVAELRGNKALSAFMEGVEALGSSDEE